jgi:hypothetical protein
MILCRKPALLKAISQVKKVLRWAQWPLLKMKLLTVAKKILSWVVWLIKHTLNLMYTNELV